MGNRNINQAFAVIACIFLLLVFVSYRARSFHYCVGFKERAQARVGSADEPCSPEEQPLEWRILGLKSKLELVGNTIAKAFEGN
jgi:hypothetical protein